MEADARIWALDIARTLETKRRKLGSRGLSLQDELDFLTAAELIIATDISFGKSGSPILERTQEAIRTLT